MKRRLLLQTALMLMVTCCWAQGPNGSGTYYKKADGYKGAALKTSLSGIIPIPSGRNVGYDGLYEGYKKTDTRPDGCVRDWYSNATNYHHGDNKGNYSKEGDMYNREHTVPQSWFGSGGIKSDIIHVVPSDGFINGKRGNLPFGEVGNVPDKNKSKNGYSKWGSCITDGYSGTVFEPNDEIKGDIARIYFHMATCYETVAPSWGHDVFSTAYNGFEKWALDMLIRWSEQDPVDDVEIARNNAVYEVQGNRNPFVDYPGLEDYIWGDKKDVPFSYDNYESGEQNIVARPIISPDAGTYYESVEVTLSCATAGASIYYTTNGEDASEQSILYEGPFMLSEKGAYTVKAVAIFDGSRSAQSEATYVITEQGGQGGGEGGEGGKTPADCEIAMNNAFFGTSFSGAINNYDDDMTATQDGVTVVYSKGTGANRYCNDTQIRLYQGNKLTVSVSQGSLTEIEFVTANTSKQLQASTGTVDSYTWTGDAGLVTFNVNSGSGNLQVTTLKIKVKVPEDPDPDPDTDGINHVQNTTNLAGQRVIYDLSGRRVTNPTSGVYIVDGRKIVVR